MKDNYKRNEQSCSRLCSLAWGTHRAVLCDGCHWCVGVSCRFPSSSSSCHPSSCSSFLPFSVSSSPPHLSSSSHPFFSSSSRPSPAPASLLIPPPLPHLAPLSRRFPSSSFPLIVVSPLLCIAFSLPLLVVVSLLRDPPPSPHRPSSSPLLLGSTLLLGLTRLLGSTRSRSRALAVAGFASPRCVVVVIGFASPVVPTIAPVVDVVVVVRSLALRLQVVRSSCERRCGRWTLCGV